jgi:hypothetical protein
MARKKLFRNPLINDVQRDRVLKRRILEERAKAFRVFKENNSRTIQQKIVDYIRGKRIENHITERILRGVIFGPKYGMSLFPKTPEEKYFDIVGEQRISRLISYIRRNPKFKSISIATEIANQNPHTQDMEYVIYDFAAEQGRRSKRAEPLVNWENNRYEIENTKKDITIETVERALLPERERRQLEREEKDKRKRGNGNSSEEYE